MLPYSLSATSRSRMQVPRLGTRSQSLGGEWSLLWGAAAQCRWLSVSSRNFLYFSPCSELILQLRAGKPEEHRSRNNFKTNILVLLQMEQMYASTALKLRLGYDAVQKITPRGEIRKSESSSKYLISEDILDVHTRKARIWICFLGM